MAFQLKNKDVILGIHKFSSSDTPIFVKKLDGSVAAEETRDGSIFVDKSLSDNKEKQAIAHEKVHIYQMAQGKLSYTDVTVTWKKDTTFAFNPPFGSLPSLRVHAAVFFLAGDSGLTAFFTITFHFKW